MSHTEILLQKCPDKVEFYFASIAKFTEEEVKLNDFQSYSASERMEFAKARDKARRDAFEALEQIKPYLRVIDEAS